MYWELQLGIISQRERKVCTAVKRRLITVCPRSSYQFHILTYYIKWVINSCGSGLGLELPMGCKETHSKLPPVVTGRIICPSETWSFSRLYSFFRISFISHSSDSNTSQPTVCWHVLVSILFTFTQRNKNTVLHGMLYTRLFIYITANVHCICVSACFM